MSLLIVGEALDLGDVFLFSLDGIDTRYKGVVAITLSLSLSCTAPGTLMVILVLLVGLTLMGGLPIRRISRGKISGLSFFRVLLLFFSGPTPSGIP